MSGGVADLSYYCLYKDSSSQAIIIPTPLPVTAAPSSITVTMSRPVSALTPVIPRSRATHPNLHIRTAHDAHVVFEAVRRGLLPMITHRLSAADRDLLRSGEVFCWEEADYKGGLERWTDGSQSRMREPFLFYTENVMMTPEEKEAKAARRARKPSDSRERSKAPQPFRRQDRPAKPDGLTKQTYSAWVTLPGTTTARKWHLTAYFTGNDYHGLPTVDQDPLLSQIIVPLNVYVTGKGLTRKSDRRPPSQDLDSESRLSPDLDQRSSVSSDCGVSPLTPSPISSFTQYRNSGSYLGKGSDPTTSPWSASSTLSLVSSTPPLPSPLHQPQSTPYAGYFSQGVPAHAPQSYPTGNRVLPPPSALASWRDDAEQINTSTPYSSQPSHNAYGNRSSIDQRAVSAFRIQL
ncbi:gti1/Pac2 family domain-containing protein [Rhizoctonia solani AG-1 IA]|uniref:Gti1/Pac2 family domain-containing protein n=1 Tax=Thanatephorus cucumeris (strain AG1-IA) TaxID=983506 RepID=L8WP56_THACA|nr:gti1/Pac2 family domain-containing protein [Rhizoctonia solani AG-1 IA]